MSEIIIHTADIGVTYTTPAFTVASVNAQVGPGFDNIVTLKGINHSADGGGQWMGIDYVHLDPFPTLVFLCAVRNDDDDWPVCYDRGTNATFVQENVVLNDLPGSEFGHELN